MTEMEACMQASLPGEAHTRLKQFEGTWTATVKLWMGPGDPHVSSGTMANTWVLGDRFLQQEYRQDDGGFEGRGYWGFNTVTGKYEGLWIDGASAGMMTETGDCDAAGKVWTMSGEADDPTSGKKVTKKSVITVHDADHHTLEMFFTGPDGSEMKGMEIQYVRA